jgi:hypothetical protein
MEDEMLGQSVTYITLHSNADADNVDNTASSFVCSLPYSLDLDTSATYDIALHQIQCDRPTTDSKDSEGKYEVENQSGSDLVNIVVDECQTVYSPSGVIASTTVPTLSPDHLKQEERLARQVNYSPAHRVFYPLAARTHKSFSIKLLNETGVRIFVQTGVKLVRPTIIVLALRQTSGQRRRKMQHLPITLNSGGQGEEFPNNSPSIFAQSLPAMFQNHTGKAWQIALSSIIYSPQMRRFPVAETSGEDGGEYVTFEVVAYVPQPQLEMPKAKMNFYATQKIDQKLLETADGAETARLIQEALRKLEDNDDDKVVMCTWVATSGSFRWQFLTR